MTTDNTHIAALQAIANAAPELDPGEGEWTSLAAAYLAGVKQGQYVAAVTARAAIAAAEAAGITTTTEG